MYVFKKKKYFNMFWVRSRILYLPRGNIKRIFEAYSKLVGLFTENNMKIKTQAISISDIVGRKFSKPEN
jgi:hypothetical protein